MAIFNKRKSIKKNNLDSTLKSKLKENFDWMTEDEDELSLEDDTTTEEGGDDFSDMGGDDLADDSMDDMGGEEDMSGESPMASLEPTELERLDSEVDELLQLDLDSMGAEEDELVEADGDEDIMNIEDTTDDVSDDLGMGGEEEIAPVTDLINTDELQNIIDSPNSLSALEDELVTKVTSDDMDGEMGMDDEMDSDLDTDFNFDEEDGLEESDEFMTENEDPFKGLSDLPGYEQGYEGEDVKDELMEDVDLTAELKALEFGDVASPLGDSITSSVSDKGIRGGADSNVKDVTDGKKAPLPTNIAPAQVMSESVKKSKMLVKAAAAILQLKKMQEAAVRESNKLRFENKKLSKVNALLAVAGDKMTKDVRKKMVESFQKCKNESEVTNLYGKVINIIKEHNRPSLNKIVKRVNPSIKTATNIIKESASNKSEVEVRVSKDQKRKAYLMGVSNTEDMYYDF